LETHLLFIDYEKAFDNTQRQILFNILKSRHIPDTPLKAIVDIYTQNKILIKFSNKLSILLCFLTEINSPLRKLLTEFECSYLWFLMRRTDVIQKIMRAVGGEK